MEWRCTLLLHVVCSCDLSAHPASYSLGGGVWEEGLWLRKVILAAGPHFCCVKRECHTSSEC
jgi:hypothetical protein